MQDLPEWFAERGVEIVCSLPHYRRLLTDSQRGDGTFDSSVAALNRLNEAGYGQGNSHRQLVLVSNPVGASLAFSNACLEKEWKAGLLENYGITFDRLIALNNMPISRFLEWLEESGNLQGYMELLVNSFNPATISGPLDVTGAPLVTLTRSTVSGTPAFGIIHNSAPLTIDGVKITNGNSGEYSGGGVLGGDSLTILHSVISGNGSDSAGGGVSATQDLTVRNSIISGNTAGNAGGGIDGESSVSIYYSTVSNNSTSGATTSVNGGGGVFATGFLKVMNSDVLNNASASAGGGVYAATGINISNSTLSGNTAMAGSGGGAYANTNSTNVTVSQSTFNDNTAQGNGGGFFGGTAVIQNSTFTGNMASGTGGAVQAGTLTLSYDTLAQNQSTGNGGGANFSSSADIGGTILYGNTPQDLTGAATANGQYDIVEVSTVAPTGSLTCDPKLAALADNGGPTQTMALGTGSCAIDAASAAPSIGNDQRGFGRPVGSGANPLADIGAFEAGAKDPDVIFADAFGG